MAQLLIYAGASIGDALMCVNLVDRLRAVDAWNEYALLIAKRWWLAPLTCGWDVPAWTSREAAEFAGWQFAYVMPPWRRLRPGEHVLRACLRQLQAHARRMRWRVPAEIDLAGYPA